MEAIVTAAPAPVQDAAPTVQLPSVGQPGPPNGAAEVTRRLRLLRRPREEASIHPRPELDAAVARRRALQAAARAEARHRAEDSKHREDERRREEQQARQREEREEQEARRREEQE